MHRRAKRTFPLFHQVEDIRWRIEQLTEDQMRMVDVAEANPRVLCAGGAGTGKTFLAERLVRRWAEDGLQVTLVCRSSWLRHFLASRLSMPGLVVVRASRPQPVSVVRSHRRAKIGQWRLGSGNPGYSDEWSPE